MSVCLFIDSCWIYSIILPLLRRFYALMMLVTRALIVVNDLFSTTTRSTLCLSVLRSSYIRYINKIVCLCVCVSLTWKMYSRL